MSKKVIFGILIQGIRRWGRGENVRLEITLDSREELVLPIHHNHLLQAAVYNLFEEEALANYVHTEGFAWGKRKFRFFCFSRLIGNCRVDHAKKLLAFDLPVKLVITSPVDFMVRDLSKGLVRKGKMILGDSVLHVVSLQARDQKVHKGEIVVRMLSPLSVYSTFDRNGKKFTYYYSPFEERFGHLVEENLNKKFRVLYAEQDIPELGCRTHIVQVKSSDFKIIKYQGIIVKGWMGTFRLSGDPRLLTLALDAGLGAKNSQGFGCCEEVTEVGQEKGGDN